VITNTLCADKSLTFLWHQSTKNFDRCFDLRHKQTFSCLIMIKRRVIMCW